MRFLSDNLIKTELSDVFIIKSCLYALCSEYLKQIPFEENIAKKASIMGAVVEYVEKNYNFVENDEEFCRREVTVFIKTKKSLKNQGLFMRRMGLEPTPRNPD